MKPAVRSVAVAVARAAAGEAPATSARWYRVITAIAVSSATRATPAMSLYNLSGSCWRPKALCS
jgi:hypothetical protein